HGDPAAEVAQLGQDVPLDAEVVGDDVQVGGQDLPRRALVGRDPARLVPRVRRAGGHVLDEGGALPARRAAGAPGRPVPPPPPSSVVVEMARRCAPTVRSRRVSARVSISAMPTILLSTRKLSSVRSARQLDTIGYGDRTTKPAQKGRIASASSPFTPTFPISGAVM